MRNLNSPKSKPEFGSTYMYVVVLIFVYIVLFFIPPIIFKEIQSFLYYLLLVVIFISSFVCMFRRMFFMLFYLQCLTFALAAYQIQNIFGVQFLLSVNTAPELTFVPSFIFCIHLIFLVFGGFLTHPSNGTTSSNFSISYSSYIFTTLCVIGILAIVIFILGVDRFFSTRNARYIEGFVSQGSDNIIEYVAKILPFFLAGAIVVDIGTKRKKFLIFTLSIFLLVLGLTISNPSTTPRYISLTGLFIFLFYLFMGINCKIYIIYFILCSPLVYSIILPLTSLMRGGFENVNIYDAVELYSSLEFSSFALYLDAVSYFYELDKATFFLFSALLIIVPRLVLPFKEEGLGIEVAENSGYIFSNASVPSFFNSYADFGLLGLIAFSVFLGMLFSRFDCLHIRQICFSSRALGYRVILLSTVPIFARGDMSTAMISIYSLTICFEMLRVIVLTQRFLLRINR